MGDSLPVSLKGVNLNRLLSRSFPHIFVADNVWPAYLKNSSEASVNESGDKVSLRFGSIKQYRLHERVKDPDFTTGAV